LFHPEEGGYMAVNRFSKWEKEHAYSKNSLVLVVANVANLSNFQAKKIKLAKTRLLGAACPLWRIALGFSSGIGWPKPIFKTNNRPLVQNLLHLVHAPLNHLPIVALIMWKDIFEIETLRLLERIGPKSLEHIVIL
jgi:hypothetical protein